MDRVRFSSDQEDTITPVNPPESIEVPPSRFPAGDPGKAGTYGARDNSAGHGAKLITPEGWKLCVHPQGMIYFYNPTLRIVVDEDIRDGAIYRSTMQKFEDLVSLGAVIKEDELELCLQPDTPDETAGQFDMFVNHAECIASYNIQDVRPAWLLSEVCRFRHSEHYGQHTVNQSKVFRARNRGPQPPPQLDRRFQPAIDLLIRVLFFGIPHTYLAHIKNSGDYRGRLSSIHANWVAYIDRLVREYSHFLLIGTVLLSATVGLLAVPGISNAVLVTALVSAFASLGSIILSVVSIWRHQINTQPRNSFMYMHNINQGPLGLHGHAMFLSLPPVLLIWGIVAFTTSLIVYTLQGLIGPLREEMNDGNGATQITMTSGWIVIAILVVILVTVLGGLYTFSVIWKFRSPKSRFRALRATLFPKGRTSVTITPADPTV
ncbi:hypothetical protein EYR38_005312 [Pleurotus pulmonarius]|nr:hypothetical protein EYR38_005312 [Pleurotus pulmonarius]